MYQTISCENYKKLGKRIFQALGFSEEESIQITEVLLYADLFGVESHGISRIQKYYRLLKEGIVNKAAVPEKIFETPISAVYDAKSAMGQIVSVNAMKEAIKMAKEHGVGMVEVKNSNHFGIDGGKTGGYRRKYDKYGSHYGANLFRRSNAWFQSYCNCGSGRKVSFFI
jgi:LDH2 family malate/lactate/ureidoglycolate dehydrogenase